MFTNKDINKIISKVDRFFTWDSRKMKKGEAFFINYDNHSCVSVHKSPLGIWAYYDVNNVKFGKFLRTWKDVNIFIREIKLIG